MRRGGLSAWLVVLWAALSSAGRADGQERNRLDLSSWIIIEEEAAPEPPLLHVAAGLLAWIDCRSQVRSDRGGVRGTELSDLEGAQGLDGSGFAPWLEATLGGKLRVGGDATFFSRGGRLERQDATVTYDGHLVAEAGDFVEASFEAVTASAFLEWDALYGRTYRLGLVGGARYFRVGSELRAARNGEPVQPVLTVRTRGELMAPFFGGLLELTPFPSLTVLTRIQFMNWSWAAIGLKEARYLEFRLGGRVHLIPDVLSVGLEYRFLFVQAAGRRERGKKVDAAMLASGVLLGVELSF